MNDIYDINLFLSKIDLTSLSSTGMKFRLLNQNLFILTPFIIILEATNCKKQLELSRAKTKKLIRFKLKSWHLKCGYLFKFDQ